MRTKLSITISILVSIILFQLVCSKKSDPAPIKKVAAMADQEISPDNPQVLIKTSHGEISVELFPEKAPITVKNFLQYVDSKFYNGTVFHRIIPTFMIQGGGFLPGMKKKETNAPIKNEAANGLSNLRGTLAMARTRIIDSATAQFFINVIENPFLNHRDKSLQGYGYCVFGRVISGMNIVDIIKEVPTRTKPPFRNIPVKDVIIESISRVTKKK